MTEITAERLQQWQQDIIAWAKDCVVWRSPDGRQGPIQFYAEQEQALREATKRDAEGRFVYKTIVFSYPKRDGKTLQAALIVAWRTCTMTDQRSVVLANSREQARSVLFDMVRRIFERSPILRELAQIQHNRIAVPALDNEVVCLPANEATVQGYAVTGVAAVDELHAAQDTGPFEMLASQTEAVDAQVIISSQAGSRLGPLFRLYQQRDEDPRLFFDYRTKNAAPWVTEEWLEQRRKQLLPSVYRYLHENAWGESGEKLFSPEQLDEIVEDYAMPRIRAEWEALRANITDGLAITYIGAGLDRAQPFRGRDRSVFTVVAAVATDPPEFWVVQQDVLPTGSEAEVTAAVNRAREIFGQLNKVIFETYQAADLAARLGAELRPASIQAQQGLFNRLYELVESRRLHIPREAELLRQELELIEVDTSGGQFARFGAPAGAHDDTVYSLAWALAAADECVCIPRKVFVQLL